jgi:hypothetical protein
LIVRLAEENRDWGYDRIAGALANLGYRVCDQTVGNVLQRHGLPPAPERKRTTTWSAFIRTHLVLLAGTDFFTAEVLTSLQLRRLSQRGQIQVMPGWLVAIPDMAGRPSRALDVGDGRSCLYPVPELNVFMRHGALHVWPFPQNKSSI